MDAARTLVPDVKSRSGIVSYCVLRSVGLDVGGQSIATSLAGRRWRARRFREYAQTIDTIARPIEDALESKPEPTSDAVEAEALAA